MFGSIKIAMVVIMLAGAGGGFVYVKNIKADLATSEANNAKLLEDFNSAVDKVRYLDKQLKMKEAQETAVTRFNDTSKNY
mgnify:CR=1 FL=1